MTASTQVLTLNLATSEPEPEDAARGEKQKLAGTPPVQHDSDSGHERTSTSSAASQCSEVDNIEDEDDGDDDDGSQSGQDCFEDASDLPLPELRPAQDGGRGRLCAEEQRASLEERLEETREILRMALSNEFSAALAACEPGRAAGELYAGLAHAVLSFLRAALTLEQEDLRAAMASINQSFEVSHARRRQVSTAGMVMRFLSSYKPNYNANYTDDEIHAELVSAESMLLLSLISFLADQSVLCLVRSALRIRACYSRYKECLYILETRTSWSSQAAKRHFESGCRMGYGVFNLLMSYLPRRALKFLEYVGFSGSRTVALRELDTSIELEDGLRSVFSALVLLTYHSYVDNLFGLGAYDDAKVRSLNQTFLAHYPNSAFFLLFQGRYHQMQGQLEEAVASFQKCCQVQQDWKQFHSLCHWEIMWCYACQMDWPRAAEYANLLRQHSKWSPSSYQYQYGTFLYQQLLEDERAGRVERNSPEFRERHAEIQAIIERVPALRIRYAGKTIPADKFAITRAAKFARQDGRLAEPALEFLYVWNIFCTLRKNPTQVQAILARLEAEIEHIDKLRPSSIVCESFGTPSEETGTRGEDKEEVEEENHQHQDQQTNNYTEDLCLLYLLRGMCLKHLDRCAEAERMFARVIELNDQITVDRFLVPHSAMELALLHLHQRRYDSARHWIKAARQDYTGYLMETLVHFRLHAATRVIRNESRRAQLEESHESTASSD